MAKQTVKASKPVTPGAKPAKQPKDGAPDKKAERQARLEAKGVDRATARQLAGVGEAVTRAELARRRIAWQRTLRKA